MSVSPRAGTEALRALAAARATISTQNVSGTFTASVRNITFPPLLTIWDELEQAVADDLRRLLNQPVIDDLSVLTEQIDEKSRTVLDPEDASPGESESPEE